MTSSAASSEDLELRGMWLRMGSAISSAIRLLMAPRAAERRWRTSAQGSSSFRARRTLSSWPMKDPELLSQDDLKSLTVDADIDGPLMDSKEKGHKAELVGHEPVEGTDCFKIKLSIKNGECRSYYPGPAQS